MHIYTYIHIYRYSPHCFAPHCPLPLLGTVNPKQYEQKRPKTT